MSQKSPFLCKGRQNSQAGFTLLELLLAMALAAVVGVAIYGLSASVMGAYDHARSMRRSDYGFKVLADVFLEDMRSIHPGLEVGDFRFVGVGADRVGAPFLQFVTASSLDLLAHGDSESLYYVRYFLRDNYSRSAYELVREERDYAGIEGDFPWKQVVVTDDIREMNIEYAKPLSKDFVPEWRAESGGDGLSRLPYAVQVRIKFVGYGEEWEELFVILPRYAHELEKTPY